MGFRSEDSKRLRGSCNSEFSSAPTTAVWGSPRFMTVAMLLRPTQRRWKVQRRSELQSPLELFTQTAYLTAAASLEAKEHIHH